MIFDYPQASRIRRHAPSGYSNYESYRSWLRDEFDFRCVYCLKRENWGQVTGEFDLDHFEPQSIRPEQRLDYFNLVYACRRCNAVKRNQLVDDPRSLLSAAFVQMKPDGTLFANKNDSRRLILQLDLNSPKLKSWRIIWQRIVDLSLSCDADLFAMLTSFPRDVPNLFRLRPPKNLRKRGLKESWFARRERGETFLV